MTVYEKLQKVQCELKAPKSQYNSFGKYPYRNCEDILEALKPLQEKHGFVTLLTDEPHMVSDRVYIKATASFVDTADGGTVTTTAFAREAVDKKGMDEAQITGATSSYARKYALNALFAIDDTKDADSQAPKEPKKEVRSIAKEVSPDDTKKAKIVSLVKKLSPTITTGVQYSQYVKQNVQLDLIPENYDEIIGRLDALVQEIAQQPYETSHDTSHD